MGLHTISSALALGLILLLSTSQAAVEIPFDLRNGLLWVPVKVPGSAEPLQFLLDSGASDSVLDLAAARKLGTKLGARRPVRVVHSTATAYRISSFRGTLGRVSIPSSLLALDLSHVSAQCSRRIDGLLGADFFRGRIVQIDYTARKVRLLARHEVTADGAHTLPLRTRDNAFCTQVGINGEPSAWTRVDTGCNSALEWSGSASQKRTGATTLGVLSGTGRSISAEVSVGNVTIPAVNVGFHPRAIFPGEAGLLGNGILSRFATVTFDPAMKRLMLKPR